MSINASFLRLQQMLRRFCIERGGNVAIIFALSMLPLIGGVGAAVDYSRANDAKSKMQAALDTTALMLSKEAAKDTSNQLQTNASKYFLALFNPKWAQNPQISVTYSTTGGSNLVVNGSASVPTEFASVLGIKTININGSSKVKWGNSRLRVALVLDNTGSMSSNGKMTALKTAAKNLLSQLNSAAQTNGDVYVSIIPFAKDVNVDPGNNNNAWIDWTEWFKKNGTCSNAAYSNQDSCTANNNKWSKANKNTWNGCVADRGDALAPNSGNYDTNVVTPSMGNKNPEKKFPADQFTPCPQTVMELSYNWSAMNTLINGMVPGGNTNQGIGLAVGWMSLVGGGPFPTPPAMSSSYTYSQIIILLTDGLNTQNRWYTNQSSINARQQMTCNNIKAAGIILYTIQVNTGGDPTSTLLQNCASSSDKFYLLTSADQIVTTFNTIGSNLTKLYVAK